MKPAVGRLLEIYREAASSVCRFIIRNLNDIVAALIREDRGVIALAAVPEVWEAQLIVCPYGPVTIV